MPGSELVQAAVQTRFAPVCTGVGATVSAPGITPNKKGSGVFPCRAGACRGLAWRGSNIPFKRRLRPLHQFAPVLGCRGVPDSEPVHTAVQTRFAPVCTRVLGGKACELVQTACKQGLHQFAPVLGCYGVPGSELVETAVQTRLAPVCTSLHLVALVQTGAHHIPLFAPLFALLFAPDFLLCDHDKLPK